MYRYRNGKHKFDYHKESAGCGLCDPTEMLVEQEFAHCYLVHNRYPYDIWENRDVIDHLMIVPKRHVGTMGEFTPEEREEIVDLICKYEAEDYSVYARSKGNNARSIHGHQHTHLIKVDTKKPKFSLFMSRPYFVVKR